MLLDPKRWYLTVPCDCGGWIVVAESQGPSSPVTLPSKLDLSCELCGQAADFDHDHARHARFKAAEGRDQLAP